MATVSRLKIDFSARNAADIGMSVSRHPEQRPHRRKNLAAHVSKSETGYFFAGSIQQQNLSVNIGSQKTAAHGIDNVLIERLQVLQFAPFLLEFGALAAKSLSETAGEIRDSHQCSKITQNPDLQFVGTSEGLRGARNSSVKRKLNGSSQQDK